MSNPVFRNAQGFKQGAPVGFENPSIPGVTPLDGRMSFDGTIAKAASLFLLAVASAVLVGMFMPSLAMPLMIIGFVLALIVMFTTKNGPKPALMATTIAVYGGAVGGISVFYEAEFGGIILQALIGTAVVFAVSLLAYRSGRIRDMGKVNKFLSIAAPAYIVF